jgi:deoxyribodipyrimidine photolyase
VAEPTTALLWLRRDLRIQDHPALNAEPGARRPVQAKAE